MSSASASESAQTPPASEQDYVFNDETCRALRKQGYENARLLVPSFTVVLFIFVAALQGVVSILAPWRELLVGVVLSVVFMVTLVAELRWFDVSLNRETIRTAWTELNRDLTREAGVHAGDPEAIEAEVLDDTSDPNARPELVFGLAPEECAPVFGLPLLVLMVGAISEIEGPVALLSVVVGCIVLSGVMFVLVTHSSLKMNTYPPEDPPYER